MVSKITLKEDGLSTLGARNIWYDDTVRRLNGQERGRLLGAFAAEDKILTIMQSGHFRLTGFNLSTHFDDDMIRIEKYDPERVWTAVYYDGDSKFYYIKRFKFDSTERKTLFITDHSKSRLVLITEECKPKIELVFDPKKGPKNRTSEIIDAEEFIDVKSYKAKGKRLSNYGLKKINLIESEPCEEPAVDEAAVEQEQIPVSAGNEEIKREENQPAEEASVEKEETRPEKEESKAEEQAEAKVVEKEKKSASKPKPKMVPVEEEVETPVLPIIDEIPVVEKKEEKAKPKKKAAAKKVKANPKKKKDNKDSGDSEVLKARLDDDKPLQIELDF
jgi:topoisomerase-4 subunit A